MKTLFISLTLFLCSQFLFAQVSKTVYLANAGTLSAELTTEELNTITDLTITGTIDATDFVIMRDSMPLLAEIDLSSVTIAEYTGTEGTAGTGNITYPVNAIPERAFCSIDNVGKNSLISVDLPKSIKKIQSYAFLNCSKISSVLIPSQVTAIGRSAFNRCTSINAVTFEINSSLETIDTMAFRGIPTLTKIEIPSTVVTIKYGAFYDCSGLETINFDSSPKLLAIEDYAFRGCTNLILIDNLPFLKQIGNYVFYRCSKLSFFDSPVIERVGNYAFYGCSGLKIFGNTPLLNYIGDRAFQNCSELDSLSIPLSTSYIGFYAFIGSNISISVDSENQIYSSEDGVLFNKTKQELIYCPKLKAGSYYLPSTVAWISNAAFYTCTALDSIILPLSLITIDDWAFEDCTGLTAIKIPASVQRIGSYAFSGCTGLSKISTNAIFPVNLSSSTSVFNIVNKTTCTLYVPFGTKASYQTANQWQDFLNIFEMPGFSLSATTATLEATQGSFTTVRISSDVTWTATSDQSWLSVDPATGFGNEQTVTIIASEANPNSTSRVTTVTVSANGVESQTISVVQAYPFEILITKIFDFESSISGKLPIASLLETDDYIFGSTSQGGTHDLGTIFKIKNDGTGYTKLFDFKGSDTGKNPIGQLTLIGDALYGTTVGDDYFGTANDTIDYGNIFKINTDGSGFMKLHEFDETNGKDPNGSLVLYNGSLYGITNDGGNESHGVIFKINPDGTGFTKVSDNSDFDTGENPYNGIIISNDVIYGVSTVDFGGVFSVNTDGTGLKKLFEMNKESGDFSYCKPLLVNDELYITTSEGGENGVGTIFKIRTDGTGFKVLYNFEGIDEDVQSSGFRNNSLIYNNGILYGTASGNGINDNGYLFKINLDGTEFLKLSDFSGDYGSLPFMCDLIIDKHKTIYGMTSLGGKYNEGIIYKFPLNDIPVANSGTDQTVYEGETVILDGSSSSDQDNDKLNYLWIYPEGITMSSDTAKRPVFTAPDVLTDTDFVFSLVVNDGIVNSEPDTVKITVLNSSNCPQHYHPVWEGTLGFDHMNINVIGARYDGMDLESGDEIGVFDGDICVGYGKVTGPIGLQNILSIKVSRDDGTGNGFTSGNEVTYRIWDCSDSSEYTVQEVTCYDI
ncbi:MAG: leucine-rich repeat protein, partial [Draconibacterium sp.]